MLTALLFLVAAPTAPKVDTEAERIRIAVAVAIEIAKAKKPAPKPPAVVAPGVATEPRFTDIGRGIIVPHPVAGELSTGLPGSTATGRIPTFATYAGQAGSTVRGCVSYG